MCDFSVGRLTPPARIQKNSENQIFSFLIEPGKNSGYRPIWLVGVSMGGLGALMYLREHPG